MSWLHVVIDVPPERRAPTAEFWAAALGWPAGAPWPDHPELRSFEPPQGRPYVHLQRVHGAPRVHVDVESAEPDGTVGRAVDLGARLVREERQWRTLTSPGGVPFCVLAAGEDRPPQPLTLPDRHATPLPPGCIAAPPSPPDARGALWR